MPASDDSSTPAAGSRSGMAPGAIPALSLLLVINLFNYIDRQVLSALLPKLKRDATIFDPTDPWRNTKLGLLTTAFMVAYMVLSPVFARAGEMYRRWFIIGIGVVLWSLASGSTGLATTYLFLLMMRCLVGVGEAAYGPIAPAMISDLFAPSVRGKVMAIFYAAIPVGSALGFVIGGQLGELLGWRHAFWATYVGIIPGLICFFMWEPKRPISQPVDQPKKKAARYSDVLRELRGIRSFVLCCAGMTCTTFVLGGVAVWVPEYIFQREARFVLNESVIKDLNEKPEFLTLDDSPQPLVPTPVQEKLTPLLNGEELSYDEIEEKLNTALTPQEVKLHSETIYQAATADNSVTTGQIGLTFGGIVVISGLFATLIGGWFGDWLRAKQVRGAYFHAAGWATILAWPFFVAMLYVPFPYAWALLFVAVFFLFFNTGPANTILANVTRSPIRATAFAINILIIHALGDAISPTLIGGMYDLVSLNFAFLVVSGLIIVGGSLWVIGSRFIDADTAKAIEADEAAPVSPAQ